MASDDKLIPTDPESESCYEALVACVRWELRARVAVGDDPTKPEGQQALAEMIADTVLDQFLLRPRTARRYHR